MKPRILFFADRYLPGRNGGGAVTALENLVALLGEEFDFYIFTRDRDATDAKPYADVPLDGWVPIGRAQVLYTSDLGSGNIQRRTREVAPDVVYLGSFFSRLTIKTLLLRRLGLLPALPVVLAPRGEFGCGALTLKRLRKLAYLKLALRLGLCRNLLWHAASELEEEQIRRQLSPRGSTANVRVAHTVPSPGLAQCETRVAKPEKRPGKCRFVFLSRIARNKNLRFALDLLASVSGEVDFDIYGPVDDPDYWAECSARMQTLPSNVKVNYFGPITYEAVPATLAAYDFLLLPTLGENFGYVILESLSAGCPVLISDQSPWCDLPVFGVGWDMPLGQLEAWQSALRQCVEMESDQYGAMSERARSFIREWASSIDFREEHLALFQQALSSREKQIPHPAFALSEPNILDERNQKIGEVHRPTT